MFCFFLLFVINELQHERCLCVLDRRSKDKERSMISFASAHPGRSLFCLHMGTVDANILFVNKNG